MGGKNSKCVCSDSASGGPGAGGGGDIPQQEKSTLARIFSAGLWRKEPPNMNKGERAKSFPEIGDDESNCTPRTPTPPSPWANNVFPTIKAALLIQRWYRRYCARMEVRRMYTWTIFQSIEYAGELDQMKLHNFFNALLTHIGHTGAAAELVEALSPRSSPIQGHRSSLEETADECRIEDIPVEYSYKGHHVKFPVTGGVVNKLIDDLKKKKDSQFLHAKYVCLLLRESSKVLKKSQTVATASTAISGQITVIGDLHGKLDDLLTILYKNGLPSTDNPYVFNGDFVDRGKKSIEVIILLCALLLAFPSDVYLNRGNHEDMIMNARYGFCKEVNRKYKTHGPRILRLLEELYRWLPLATVIDQKVLVVHGGISDKTDINRIAKVDRGKYISVLKIPEDRIDFEDDAGQGDREQSEEGEDEWKLILDLLWSDPQDPCGCCPNVFRGGGTYFGPDITKNILELHGYKLLIRSHECKVDGYEYMHDNLCLTIFSASNYYETGSNRGAYVKLQGKDLEPHFVQYTSDTKQKQVTIRQRVGRMESSAIKELKTQILGSKADIIHGFKKIDKQGTGLISLHDWVQIMEEKSNLKIPWRVIRDRLATIDPVTGHIEYMTTFSDDKASLKGGPTVVDALYRHKNSLETIFRLIDKDNSGFISMDEFEDACELISKHMNSSIPKDEIVDLANSIDINKDGQIDFNEFLECFRIVGTEKSTEDDDEDEDE